MARKRDNRNLQKGRVYHFYNRGNWFEDIGFDAEDFQKYLQIMHRYALRYKQRIVAYTLMPNHFHLIIKLGVPLLTINFIKFFSGGCARFYNKKYSKVGHLFQDKYKHRIIGDELDLVYVSRYIHRNPLSINEISRENLHEYPYSSFREYIGIESDTGIRKEEVLKFFPYKSDYYHFVVAEELDQQAKFLSSKDFLGQRIAVSIKDDWNI